MTGLRKGLVGLIAMLALLTSLPAAAQTIESLVMPGDVVSGHAEIETECASCHLPFNRREQRNLCIDCHELVAIDIELHLGYHGRSEDGSTEECSSCHTDHEGRNADIVELDETTFDHDFTDFALLGHHADAECVDCHVPDEKHRDASNECSSCHAEDKPHEQDPAELCTDCHNESEWADVHFDHDSTDYALIGKHAETACNECHDVVKFEGTDDTCFACHEDDDEHNGKSGNDCGNCHNPTDWADTSFNHQRDTDFPLEGGHAELACGDCHTDDPFGDEMDMACVSCHLEDDDHEGHNGIDCAACHSDVSWTDSIFDHSRDTEYELLGSHADLACVDCHVEPIFEVELETECASCHVDDDVHEGSQGEQCADCHNETTWEDVPYFDHDLTKFPLLGEHDNVECEDCHDTQVFVDAEEDCVACHLEDDNHDGVFADNCASCHNPVAWDLWLFDHNAQTDFLLEGAHVDVACEDCHRSSLEQMQKIGTSCIDCHRSDDIHDGEFGPDCGRCHSDSTFEEVRSLQ
jgi:hypothetical protein